MPCITQQLFIRAPRGLVFDLSRSIELHQISTSHTHEQAVAGRTSGLIGLHETVTWRARHLGLYQHLTARITELQYPDYFVDEMVRGAFKRFRHVHRLEEQDGGTLLTDIFDYTSPLGLLGRLADWLFLERYMRDLLHRRNLTIKEFAESGKGEQLLQR